MYTYTCTYIHILTIIKAYTFTTHALAHMIVAGLAYFPVIQWIGSRENHTGTPHFLHGKIYGVRFRFSLEKQTHWIIFNVFFKKTHFFPMNEHDGSFVSFLFQIFKKNTTFSILHLCSWLQNGAFGSVSKQQTPAFSPADPVTQRSQRCKRQEAGRRSPGRSPRSPTHWCCPRSWQDGMGRAKNSDTKHVFFFWMDDDH